jgi:hypothetical protein
MTDLGYAEGPPSTGCCEGGYDGDVGVVGDRRGRLDRWRQFWKRLLISTHESSSRQQTCLPDLVDLVLAQSRALHGMQKRSSEY